MAVVNDENYGLTTLLSNIPTVNKIPNMINGIMIPFPLHFVTITLSDKMIVKDDHRPTSSELL